MADITDTRTTTDNTATSNTATTWIGGSGLALIAIGMLAAVVMWSDMSGSDFGYTPIQKWQSVLTALIVVGLGLVTLAISAVLARINR